jgi:3-hydroxyisobutyrate dehydrogenase-like beta-hydroxyacid dehydrogenase
MKIGFVGLGGMGRAMAEGLLDRGYDLLVYNRSPAKAEPLRAKGAKVASSAAKVALESDLVFSMLADDAAVEAVTLGDEGILRNLPEGGTHVSCSTISVDLAARLSALHGPSRGYVSAPVFGRPDAAAAKKLWVIAAGPKGHVDRCLPVLEALGRGVTRLGESATAANLVKLAGNFVIAAMLETLGEAYALTSKGGVPPEVFCDVFVNVFTRSPIFEGYAKRIAAGSYEPAGFKARLGLKDVRLALAAGEESEVQLPIAILVRDHLLSAVAQGSGDLDWSVVARLAAERAGISGQR